MDWRFLVFFWGGRKRTKTDTLDGSEIVHRDGINYQPQLVIAGFLNHLLPIRSGEGTPRNPGLGDGNQIRPDS